MASSHRGSVGASSTNTDHLPTQPTQAYAHLSFHHNDARAEDDTSDDSSVSASSSYIASDDESVTRPITSCRWRTPRFHNQECERFFDCPSHQVERQLSDDESDSDENRDEPEPARDITTTIEAAAAAPAAPAVPAADTQTDGPVGRTSVERGVRVTRDERVEPPPHVPAVASQASLTQSLPTGLTQRTSSGSVSVPIPSAPGSRPPPPPPPPPLPTFALRPPPRVGPSRPIPPPVAERRLPEIVLPRWQPDAEVTYCPICHTQFSIFVRKHHCRKCGRVVCNSCSPHRITIPYQYIVRNPAVAAPRQPTSPASADGDQDFGGERVRLCNPCVPDPNTTPPQPQPSPGQFSPRGHGRSQSTLISAHLASPTAASRHGGPATSGSSSSDAYPRARSSTMHASLHQPSSSSRHLQPSQAYMDPRTSAAGGLPLQHQATAPPFSSQRPPGTEFYRGFLTFAGASSSSSHRGSSNRASSSSQRALPPEPLQIAEEDECPVCHRELPSARLPDSENLREQHITSCIAAHSAYGGGAVQGSPDGRAVITTRRSGMFPYLATEKDCVDSAECTICLEEFEVGVPMARLECLCRFHKSCIMAWFVGHPGRCPVHQHDGFGF